MSRSVDLFISSDAPIDDLAELLVARCDLTDVTSSQPGDGPETAPRVRLLAGEGHTAALSVHGFVDDDELVLSAYRYVLSLRVTATGHLGTRPETAFLRRVATGLDAHRVLLVLDLQYRCGPEAPPVGDGSSAAEVSDDGAGPEVAVAGAAEAGGRVGGGVRPRRKGREA